MQDFLTALCLVMILEGVLPFLAPDLWKKTVKQLSDLTDQQLRTGGLVCMLVGVVCLLWLR